MKFFQNCSKRDQFSISVSNISIEVERGREDLNDLDWTRSSKRFWTTWCVCVCCVRTCWCALLEINFAAACFYSKLTVRWMGKMDHKSLKLRRDFSSYGKSFALDSSHTYTSSRNNEIAASCFGGRSVGWLSLHCLSITQIPFKNTDNG